MASDVAESQRRAEEIESESDPCCDEQESDQQAEACAWNRMVASRIEVRDVALVAPTSASQDEDAKNHQSHADPFGESMAVRRASAAQFVKKEGESRHDEAEAHEREPGPHPRQQRSLRR